jgi:hypothetical protein
LISSQKNGSTQFLKRRASTHKSHPKPSGLEQAMQRIGNLNLSSLNRPATGRIETERIGDNMRLINTGKQSPVADLITRNQPSVRQSHGQLKHGKDLETMKYPILNIVD